MISVSALPEKYQRPPPTPNISTRICCCCCCLRSLLGARLCLDPCRAVRCRVVLPLGPSASVRLPSRQTAVMSCVFPQKLSS